MPSDTQQPQRLGLIGDGAQESFSDLEAESVESARSGAPARRGQLGAAAGARHPVGRQADATTVAATILSSLRNARAVGLDELQRDFGSVASSLAEGLELYVPLANGLGMARLRRRLEDVCFRLVEPEAYALVMRGWPPSRPKTMPAWIWFVGSSPPC